MGKDRNPSLRKLMQEEKQRRAAAAAEAERVATLPKEPEEGDEVPEDSVHLADRDEESAQPTHENVFHATGETDEEPSWVHKVEKEEGLKFEEEIIYVDDEPEIPDDQRKEEGEDNIEEGNTSHLEEKRVSWVVGDEDEFDEEADEEGKEIAYYNPLQTAFHSELDATKAKTVTRETAPAGVELPVGFFDDPEKDAEVRGEALTADQKEKELDLEFRRFEEAIGIETQKEENLRFRRDERRAEDEMAEQLAAQEGLIERLENLKRRREEVVRPVAKRRKEETVEKCAEEDVEEDISEEILLGNCLDWRAKSCNPF